jgi:hypothetical protein
MLKERCLLNLFLTYINVAHSFNSGATHLYNERKNSHKFYMVETRNVNLKKLVF